jgi:hypothetical protein
MLASLGDDGIIIADFGGFVNGVGAYRENLLKISRIPWTFSEKCATIEEHPSFYTVFCEIGETV